jgi:hypothetical protein
MGPGVRRDDIEVISIAVISTTIAARTLGDENSFKHHDKLSSETLLQTLP